MQAHFSKTPLGDQLPGDQLPLFWTWRKVGLGCSSLRLPQRVSRPAQAEGGGGENRALLGGMEKDWKPGVGCVCVAVCVTVCLWMSMNVSISVFVNVCLSVCVCVSDCVYV